MTLFILIYVCNKINIGEQPHLNMLIQASYKKFQTQIQMKDAIYGRQKLPRIQKQMDSQKERRSLN